MYKKLTSRLPSVPSRFSSSSSSGGNEEDSSAAPVLFPPPPPPPVAESGHNSNYNLTNVYGFMKKAQSAATSMVKETSIKASELKKKAMDAADMDNLQKKLNAVLDNYENEVDITALDFTYIDSNLAVMGFPSQLAYDTKVTTNKYNPIRAVAQILNTKHQGKYMIWNLSEEPYEYSLFNDQVLEFKFPGYPAPPLGLLFKICTSVENWLIADDNNLAVVHCLTGKGRTSTVVACYLSWVGEFDTPMEALQYISIKRHSEMEKLTIPSQRRYIQYFTNMLDGVKPRSSPLVLKRVIVNQIPVFSSRQSQEDQESLTEEGCCPYLQIFKNGKLVFTTTWKDSEKGTGVEWKSSKDGSIHFDINCLLQGDILMRCRHLEDSGHRISMFRAAFHTGYIPLGILRLTKAQLDGACQDDRFASDFFVDLIFAPVQNEAEEVKEAEGCTDSVVRICKQDKELYDDMLVRDEKFWLDITKRKERRAKNKQLKKSENTSSLGEQMLANSKATNLKNADVMSSFSILSGEDESNIHVEKSLPTKMSSWDEAADLDLQAELESIEPSSISNGNKNLSPKSLPPKDNAEFDAEIAALAKLEEELGLNSFSKEIQNFPSNSDEVNNSFVPSNAKEDSSQKDLLDGELLDFQDSEVSTDGDNGKNTEDADFLNDDFDELEEYLTNLSSK